jgi:hypothetical protein
MVAYSVPDPGYWSLFVDISEHVEGLPEALDDDARSSSSESSSHEEGVGPSRRAFAAPMDPDFLKTMTISNEFRSIPGLGLMHVNYRHDLCLHVSDRAVRYAGIFSPDVV